MATSLNKLRFLEPFPSSHIKYLLFPPPSLKYLLFPPPSLKYLLLPPSLPPPPSLITSSSLPHYLLFPPPSPKYLLLPPLITSSSFLPLSYTTTFHSPTPQSIVQATPTSKAAQVGTLHPHIYLHYK